MRMPCRGGLRCKGGNEGGRDGGSTRWCNCIRPDPAHEGVMLCTGQCRPASACIIKSPPGCPVGAL